MAKFLKSGKWKRGVVCSLAAALSLTLSLGALSACKDAADNGDDDNETPAIKADTQLIKNGNFEYYSEMTTELADKRAFLNTPTSWSFSSGSPSSDTRSGLIDVTEFDYLSKSGREFTSVADAYAHWEDEEVTLYDRLRFYQDYKTEIDDLASSSDEAKLFAKYKYSIDFEDVEKLNEELGGGIKLHDDENQRENGETGVLMIHNQRTSDGVRGTGQYYTSSTTITLQAGTSAQLSVWVKTSNLFHYYDADATEVSRRAGAYIGVTHSVGGTSLAQMQIKNINTKNVEDNNGWEKYDLYIRANTFATTTFSIVLGLGSGSTDDRYESVDGYAFFDDLTCKVISNDEYEAAIGELKDTGVSLDDCICTIDDKKEDKLFDATEFTGRTFALDLYADDETENPIGGDVTFGLTKETSGSRTYTSADIDKALADNRGAGERDSVVGKLTLGELAASSNGYLKSIYEDDFKDKFFEGENDVIMLLSTNGAAYTAVLPTVTLQPDTRKMISFFVKTSKIINGRSGASITLVDGENKTSIAAFDSTAVATVDIDDDNKDIYNGWVQCFFFVSNDTDEPADFHLELSFGPTTIVGSNKSQYGQGYAAFAKFETRSLTTTQLGYASTGDRAMKVSLTGKVSDTTSFDVPSATGDIEKAPVNPASYQGISGGSKNIVAGGQPSAKPETVVAGLLNSEHKDKYAATNSDWFNLLNGIGGTSSDWWENAFGTGASVARQPLVIMNTGAEATASYGFVARSNATVSASTYQRISMRVKASAGTTAYIYLVDKSKASDGSAKLLAPNMPDVTYWYDDEGNICASDPSAKDFDEDTGVLFTLEKNGLYKRVGGDDTLYANLYNLTQRADGHLETSDGTIAFYGKDGKYYAYGNEETQEYSQEVVCLPKEIDGKKITRYDYSETAAPETVIAVPGTGEWTEVSFYLHTGSASKTYRLEIWAGERTNAADGIPSGGYVFFDNYSSATVSNYDTILSDTIDSLKENDGNVDENGNIKAATYYTYTFFDAADYLRYDENEDEDKLGNPYGSYKQSGYSETLIYLLHEETREESETGIATKSLFLDYSATDVTVEKDDLGNTDDGDSDDEDTDTPVNVWLILSSGVLAVVLLFAVIVVLVRTFRPKKAADKKVRGKKKSE